jgi:hypothetical protein
MPGLDFRSSLNHCFVRIALVTCMVAFAALHAEARCVLVTNPYRLIHEAPIILKVRFDVVGEGLDHDGLLLGGDPAGNFSATVVDVLKSDGGAIPSSWQDETYMRGGIHAIKEGRLAIVFCERENGALSLIYNQNAILPAMAGVIRGSLMTLHERVFAELRAALPMFKDPRVKGQLLLRMGEIASLNEAPFFEDMLDDPEPTVRHGALGALAAIEPTSWVVKRMMEEYQTWKEVDPEGLYESRLSAGGMSHDAWWVAYGWDLYNTSLPVLDTEGNKVGRDPAAARKARSIAYLPFYRLIIDLGPHSWFYGEANQDYWMALEALGYIGEHEDIPRLWWSATRPESQRIRVDALLALGELLDAPVNWPNFDVYEPSGFTRKHEAACRLGIAASPRNGL